MAIKTLRSSTPMVPRVTHRNIYLTLKLSAWNRKRSISYRSLDVTNAALISGSFAPG